MNVPGNEIQSEFHTQNRKSLPKNTCKYAIELSLCDSSRFFLDLKLFSSVPA